MSLVGIIPHTAAIPVIVLFCLILFPDVGAPPEPKESQKLHDKIDKLMEKTMNGNKLKFWELFKGPTEYERLQLDPLGDKENRYGVVYKIRQRNKPTEPILAMKIVRVGTFPNEFANHKSLYEHKFPGVNHKFIPKVFGEKLLSSTKDMEFYVMEYVGETVNNLEDTEDDNVRLKPNEALLFLARSYLVLREIHSFGYIHNDAHGNNWAYSRTQVNVLFLFDFGESHKLVKFSDVAADLFWWHRNVEWMSTLLLEDAELTKASMPHITEIDKIMKDVYVYDNAKKTASAANGFNPGSFDAYTKLPIIDKLDKRVKLWLKKDTPNDINSAQALSRWSEAEVAIRTQRLLLPRSLSGAFKSHN